MNKGLILAAILGFIGSVGCTKTGFKGTNGAPLAKASSEEYGSISDSSASVACKTELLHEGFTLSADLKFKRQKKTGCSYAGIGFRDLEIVVDGKKLTASVCQLVIAAVNSQDPQTAAAQDLVGDAARKGADEIPAPPPADLAATIEVRELSSKCVSYSRCGTGDDTAFGRIAWMRKCQAQNASFREYFQDTLVNSYHQLGQLPAPKLESPNGAIGDNQFPKPSIVSSPPKTIYTMTPAEILAEIDAAVPSVAEPCTNAAQAVIVSYCTSGCYKPEQRLLTNVSGEYREIAEAADAGLQDIAILSRASTLESPQYVQSPVGYFIKSDQDKVESILHFRTASGLKLAVTLNHPLLDGDGVMREAGTLKVGESLVQASGEKDPIVSIEHEEYYGKVHNVAPRSDKIEDNMVVSEGLINGSHLFQTKLLRDLNHRVLRSRLSEGL